MQVNLPDSILNIPDGPKNYSYMNNAKYWIISARTEHEYAWYNQFSLWSKN